jgi:colanic acid/amylovoran biosynthesis protein
MEGYLISFTTLDDLVLCNNRPLIIWGASIGPFKSVPDYERYMGDHLQKVTGIFARVSATITYLQSIGISKNVYAVADPAFVMDAVQSQERVYIDKGAIGLNLSPLMATFITGGDMEQWTKIAAAIIAKVADRTEGQVYLIPHVTNPNSNNYTFMQRALSLISEDNKDVVLVPPVYNAAETKWIISKMAVFAGARTHSTIATISSGVPTLSFSYSMKARGISRDIFGHADYCLEPTDMNAEVVSSQINSILTLTLMI